MKANLSQCLIKQSAWYEDTGKSCYSWVNAFVTLPLEGLWSDSFTTCYCKHYMGSLSRAVAEI
jgi:hypothetical protein